MGTEGLLLKAKVHRAKVPDQDGLRLLLESARTGLSRLLLTCGWTPALRGQGQEVGRGGDGLERGGGAQATQARARGSGEGFGGEESAKEGKKIDW